MDRYEREIWEKLKESDAQFLSPDYHLLSMSRWKNLPKELHEKKIQLVPWTVNESSDWKELLSRFKVDGIITDDPELLIEYLKGI